MSFRMWSARACASATRASPVRRASLVTFASKSPWMSRPVSSAKASSWYARRRRAFCPRSGASRMPSANPAAPPARALHRAVRVVRLRVDFFIENGCYTRVKHLTISASSCVSDREAYLLSSVIQRSKHEMFSMTRRMFIVRAWEADRHVLRTLQGTIYATCRF